MDFFQHRILLLSCLLVGLLAFAGCRSKDPDFDPHVTRLYLEESAHMPPSHIREMILPISESRITVQAKPDFAEWDIMQATPVETDFGAAIVLLLTSEASRDLYRTTVSNQGRRLVITINGVPVGAHYIERPVEDGRLFFYLEVPDEEVPAIARGIQKTSAEIERRSSRNGW